MPQRGRIRRQRRDRHRDARLGVLDDVLDRLVDHLVEGLGVLAQLRGGAGERLGDARAELGLEHRQHPLAHAHAREPRVAVVRIVPRLEALRGARGAGGRAADVEERSQQRACRSEIGSPRPCPAGSLRPIRARGRAAPSRPGRPGCGRAARPRRGRRSRHPGSHGTARRARPPRVRRRRRRRPGSPARRGRARSPQRAAAAATSAEPSCSPWSTVTEAARRPSAASLEGRRRGEGERVGAAGERDEHRRAGRAAARAPGARRAAPPRQRGRGPGGAPRPHRIRARAARELRQDRASGTAALRAQDGPISATTRAGSSGTGMRGRRD